MVCLEVLDPVEYAEASAHATALSEKVSAVNPVNTFHAAWRVASVIRSEGHIPAVVEIHLPLTRLQGEPLDFVPTVSGGVSFAEAFYALAILLDQYEGSGPLPGKVTVTETPGPVSHPMYELPEKPKFDTATRIGDWQPFNPPREYFPSEELGQSQGLSGGPRPSPRTASTLTMNPAELLYPMVLKYLTIEIMGKAEPVHISSKKIIEDLVARSVTVSTPVRRLGGRLGFGMTRYDTFPWRWRVTRWLLNRAGTHTPSSD